MLFSIFNIKPDVYNLSSWDTITIKEIAKILINRHSPYTKIRFTGTERGWKGDVIKMCLDTKKLNDLGWKAKYNSYQAVVKTIEAIK